MKNRWQEQFTAVSLIGQHEDKRAMIVSVTWAILLS